MQLGLLLVEGLGISFNTWHCSSPIRLCLQCPLLNQLASRKGQEDMYSLHQHPAITCFTFMIVFILASAWERSWGRQLARDACGCTHESKHRLVWPRQSRILLYGDDLWWLMAVEIMRKWFRISNNWRIDSHTTSLTVPSVFYHLQLTPYSNLATTTISNNEGGTNQ